MAALPDWTIRNLCTHWPTHWTPPRTDPAPERDEEPGVRLGLPAWRLPEARPRRLPIPDAGPLADPFDPELLGPAALDMRIGNVFESPMPLAAWVTRGGARLAAAQAAHGPAGWAIGERAVREAGATGVEVALEPGQPLACISAEYYRLPPDVRGQLFTKSSRAREWLDHSSATTVHPGFQGRIAFEIINNGSRPYTVRTGMRIMQIAFDRMEGPAETPYFMLETAKYRGQLDSVSSADPGGRA